MLYARIAISSKVDGRKNDLFVRERASPPPRTSLASGRGPMGRTEADEIAELKSMFSSPTKGTVPINRRPAWDGTPLRSRPAALVGLKPVTREPWAIDEDVYNRKFETRDVGIRARTADERTLPVIAVPLALTCVPRRVFILMVAEDRYLDKTARSRQMGTQLIDYMCRFDQKYSELNGTYDRFDGNPFT